MYNYYYFVVLQTSPCMHLWSYGDKLLLWNFKVTNHCIYILCAGGGGVTCILKSQNEFRVHLKIDLAVSVLTLLFIDKHISEIQDLSLYTRTLAELNYLHYFVWDLTPLLMSDWWHHPRLFHPGMTEVKKNIPTFFVSN